MQRLGDRLTVRADVDLLAPVDQALGAFAAGAGVAAEVRGAGVLDGELVRLGQGEEALSGLQQGGEVCGGDAVAGEVEEPD
nr:hypothetical protein GCM10023233_32790 [Brevibacterium otitidis]